ncbi:UNVERIFIED_CONTAM: hypothetical protein K2H54_033389 [Gekko kuhli]
MAKGVTYTDLHFAKNPSEKSQSPGEVPRKECSNGKGKLTYKNFPATAQPCQPAGPDPSLQLPGQSAVEREGAHARLSRPGWGGSH